MSAMLEQELTQVRAEHEIANVLSVTDSGT
jgi:hypothetical protein